MNNCPVARIQEAEKKFQASVKMDKIDWYAHANLYNDLIRARHEVKQCVEYRPHVPLSGR